MPAPLFAHLRTGAAGDSARAAELNGLAYERCRTLLGRDHPYTAIAAHNLGIVTKDSVGADQDWREIDVDIPET